MDYLSSANGDSTPCPSCRSPFSIDLSQESVDVVDDGTLVVDKADKAGPSLKELTHVPTGSILRRINLAEFATSTKIEALVQELIDMRQKRPGSKAVRGLAVICAVFCHFSPLRSSFSLNLSTCWTSFAGVCIRIPV